jgi:hypothetical protein
MKKEVLVEILDAAHLTKYIEYPFQERGGLMLVAPPNSLKTTIIHDVLIEHYDSVVVGDINVKTLLSLRSDIRGGKANTLAFTEYEKLYQRRQDTSMNIEGIIKQMVCEGFTRASFEDQTIASGVCRVMVVGAMTETFYKMKWESWKQSGFARRFIWSIFALKNPYVLVEAIHEWKKLDLGLYLARSPGNKTIPMNVTEPESRKIIKFMTEQESKDSTGLILLKKILAVLKWKYDKKEPGKAMQIVEEFSESLKKNSDCQIEL